MATTPWMTGPGNHEYSCEHHGCEDETSGFATYIMRFALPVNTYGGNTPMWYSFNRANVHYVVVSSETDYPHAFFQTQFGDQLKWLEQDLSTAVSQRSARPWIVVGMHRPLYSNHHDFVDCDKSNSTCWPHGQAEIVTRAFESLFMKYNVDLVFAGHVHSYSRTFGVESNGTLVSTATHNPQAPWYVVAGGAGNEEGLSQGYRTPVPWAAHYCKRSIDFCSRSRSRSRSPSSLPPPFSN